MTILTLLRDALAERLQPGQTARIYLLEQALRRFVDAMPNCLCGRKAKFGVVSHDPEFCDEHAEGYARRRRCDHADVMLEAQLLLGEKR